MRTPALRLAPLALSLTLIACAAAPGCAKERLQMDPSLAHQAFPDDRMAQIAEAVARGDATRIRQLAQGVDLDAQGDKGVTLLEWAIYSQSTEGLRALLEAGADPSKGGAGGDTVVHLASKVDDPKYLEVLLRAGVDVNAPNVTTGSPPLASAALMKREPQIRLLLDAGADPNRADRTGNTPLHAAAKQGDAGVALQLLERGADPMTRNAQGATFQEYMFTTPERILTAEAKRERAALREWLDAKGMPLAPDTK